MIQPCSFSSRILLVFCPPNLFAFWVDNVLESCARNMQEYGIAGGHQLLHKKVLLRLGRLRIENE